MAAALLLGSAVWAAAPALAATGVAATTSGDIGGLAVTSAACGQAFVPDLTVGCTRTGPSAARITVRARAEADSRLRGSTFATHAAAATDTLGSASASSTDTVSFGELAGPVSVSIRLRLTGTQSASTDAVGELGASTSSFIRLGVRRDGSMAPGEFDEIVLVRSLRDFGTFEVNELNTQRTVRGVSSFESMAVSPTASRFNPVLTFDLAAGATSFEWFWQFATSSRIETGFSGTARTRYFNTASILGLEFRDADGVDVSDSLGVSFASGINYPLGAPAVPEPSSWALMIAGFGLAGAALRRRDGRRLALLPAGA
ncbi:MAG: PEPxxWA-CTERM sorting domain-containing protein [Sandaracinobacteroides sp.]